MNAEQVIPKITDPLGKHWEQPARKHIELDDTHALMSEQTFLGLANYTSSQPTGIYPGKMWRGQYLKKGEKVWKLHWVELDPDDDKYCFIRSRFILVV